MSDPKPCGKYHPLPCGLDKDCPVPDEYFVAALDNEEIVELYKEKKNE